MRDARAGFTLLELMVALTLSATALGVAGMALSTARRTGDVVTQHQQVDDADVRVRAMLSDMLRHAPAATRSELPLLSIVHDGDGAVLQFLSLGVRAPFGTGVLWQVSVRVAHDSLQLVAEPVERSGAGARIVATVPATGALEVLALEGASRGDAARWRPDWPLAQTRPSAVSLAWHTDSPPLVVTLDPVGVAQP
jgi:general secretion pathway protein J